MTKEQIVWLLVRITGTLSIFNSLRFAFIILENVLLVTTAEVQTITISRSSGLITGWVLEAIVYFTIGIYLMLNGRILFDLLNREPAGEEEATEKQLRIS